MENAIAILNDRFRKQLGMPPFFIEDIVPGRVLMTAGITALPPVTQIHIWAEVRDYDRFHADDDPYGEHDFGSFDCPGAGRIFWKIDYYAPDMLHGSEDPADTSRTVRVLTIMLASEY